MTETIAQLGIKLQTGQTSRETRVRQTLEAAGQAPAAHVFTRLYAESALASARHADAQAHAGARLHPLAGLPVSIKDLYDVAGETTLAGSKVCEGQAPATS
jgi:aspartyl-tRNA(Asn)/glutamyl-tRNA(Gln) amidotransferase subunit A